MTFFHEWSENTNQLIWCNHDHSTPREKYFNIILATGYWAGRSLLSSSQSLCNTSAVNRRAHHNYITLFCSWFWLLLVTINTPVWNNICMDWALVIESTKYRMEKENKSKIQQVGIQYWSDLFGNIYNFPRKLS